MTDLASHSQFYPTVTLSRQQSSGLLATMESERELKRKGGENKEMRVIEERRVENERRPFC